MQKDNSNVDRIESGDYGEKWFPDKKSFEEDLKEVWGNKWSQCGSIFFFGV